MKTKLCTVLLLVLCSVIAFTSCSNVKQSYDDQLVASNLQISKLQIESYFRDYLDSIDGKPTPTIPADLKLLVQTYTMISDSLSILDVGSVQESCASRCHHECEDVGSQFWCTMNCSTPDCHPACCGCPGTYIDGSCDGCKAPSDVCD